MVRRFLALVLTGAFLTAALPAGAVETRETRRRARRLAQQRKAGKAPQARKAPRSRRARTRSDRRV